MSNPPLVPSCSMNRRTLLNTFGMGLGGLALNEMLCKEVQAVNGNGALQHVHHAPKAKRVIYLFQAGGPSQLDLFDNKPTLVKRTGQQLPESVRGGTTAHWHEWKSKFTTAGWITLHVFTTW